jgi:hypothetical protein
MVEGKLSFNLPGEFKWLTAIIVGTSPDVKASVATEEHRLIFSTGLFRCSEFIRFQSVAEVPVTAGLHTDTKITVRLEKAIKIEHRIADTRPVAIIYLPNEPAGKRRVSRLVTLALTNTAIMVVMCVIFGFYFGGMPGDLHFLVSGTNMPPTEVSLVPMSDGSVKVNGVNVKYRERLPVTTFFDKYHPTAKVVPAGELKLMAGMLLFVCAMPWVTCAAAYRDRRRGNKLRHLLVMDGTPAATEGPPSVCQSR